MGLCSPWVPGALRPWVHGLLVALGSLGPWAALGLALGALVCALRAFLGEPGGPWGTGGAMGTLGGHWGPTALEALGSHGALGGPGVLGGPQGRSRI